MGRLSCVTIMLICFAFPGCAVNRLEPSRIERPGWIDRVPHDKNSEFFIGSIEGADSLDAAKTGAEHNGRVKVAEFLGTKIQAVFEAETTELDQRVRDRVKATTSGLVSKASIEDFYYVKQTKMDGRSVIERYDAYVLIRFPNDEADKELRRREAAMREKALSAYALYEEARRSEVARETARARRLYAAATQVLAELEGIILYEGKDLKNSRELKLAVQQREHEVIALLRRVAIWVPQVSQAESRSVTVMVDHLADALSHQGFSMQQVPSILRLAHDPYEVPSISWLARLKEIGIQYLITVEAIPVYSSQTMGNHFYYADGSAKVFETGTGEAVLTIPIHSRGNHRSVDQAIRNALAAGGKECGELLAKELLARESAK